MIDILARFGASEDELARDEDEGDDPGVDHAVDEAREELWLVGAKVGVGEAEGLETDGKVDGGGGDDVLDLKVLEFDGEVELLDDAREPPRGQPRCVLALGAGDHHLAGREDQRGGLGVPDADDHGREPLGVVLCVAGAQGDLLQVQRAPQVGGGHDVLQGRHDAGGMHRPVDLLWEKHRRQGRVFLRI